MDVTPPSPTAVVQAEQAPAVDALRRLATTRRELATLLAQAPTPDVSHIGNASALLHGLDAFWRDGSGEGTRSALLARYIARAMRDEASLRAADGTLDARAARLVARGVSIDEPMPAGVQARELVFGDRAYAGALILIDATTPDLALLFTAQGGWEAYDSLDHLLQAARTDRLETLDALEAPGMGSDELGAAKATGTVGSRVISGAAPIVLAERMIETQARRLALAADDFMLDRDRADATEGFTDPLRRILRPEALLDIQGMLQWRAARLVEATTAERLDGLPRHVRDAWLEARDAYDETLQAATELRVDLALPTPLPLRAFASQAIDTRLAALGVTLPASAITVEVSRLPDPTQPLELVGQLLGSDEVRRVPLVDLAYENIGHLAWNALRAVDGEGTSLAGRLGQAVVRKLVRDLDLPGTYRAHVEGRMRQGRGELARSITLALQRDRMRLDAMNARLAYYQPGGEPSFLDDRDERGFRLVEAALDQLTPADRRTVDGHPVAVRQLSYKHAPLADILLFTVGNAASAPRVVAYTPHAPDGVAFREFEDRADMARRFLYHPAFREYLLDRMPAEFSRLPPNGHPREFATDRRAHWVLGAARDAAYTVTDEPFDERVVEGDFLAASYDAGVDLVIRDSRYFARDTTDADRDALFALPVFQGRFDAGAYFMASSLVEIPTSVVRAVQASWRLYDHAKAGDMGQAFVAFAEGYASALNVVTPPFIGGRSLARAWVRSRTAAAGIVDSGVNGAGPPAMFETRYIARRPRRAGAPDHEGIYHADERSYILHEREFYAVHRDRENGTWRLARPDGIRSHPDITGPAIERVNGQWQFNHDVGLRGGMRRIRERFRRILRLQEDAPAAAAANEPPPPPREPLEARPRPHLPESLEHLRTQILTDAHANPSAQFVYRADGSSAYFDVRTRSAFILDPNLAPDVAALTPHQRRVFLHEMETRFPQVAERGEVLNARGWAR
ncbi:MAG: hypothetical protein WBW32_19635, partial [Luteibacter sp.]